MTDAPAFDFYPERWLAGTASMSALEQALYLRLLCHQWIMDGIPDDPKAIKRLCGRPVPESVLAKFPKAEDGTLRNKMLENIRANQRARIAKSLQKIERMNAARLAKSPDGSPKTPPLVEPLVEPLVGPLQEPLVGPPHHSPLTTVLPTVVTKKRDSVPELDLGLRSSKAKPANIDEVLAYAKTGSIPAIEAGIFWDMMEAGGWMRGKLKVKDWRAHLRTYHRLGYLTPKSNGNGYRTPNLNEHGRPSGDPCTLEPRGLTADDVIAGNY